MSERKDEEEMVGQEDSSEPSEESEELIDADVEQHNSPHSPDEESPAGNGEEEEEEESEEGDKNLESGKEEVSLNEEKREGSGLLHREPPRANGIVPSGDVNRGDEIVKDEEDEDMGEAEAEADATEKVGLLDLKQEEEEEKGGDLKNVVNAAEVDHMPEDNGVKDVATVLKHETAVEEYPVNTEGSNQSFLFTDTVDADDNGTEEEQAAFMKELENFFKERSLEFKPPKFYGEGLNCLKLWRAVTKLGGYDRVTTCKLWRQVGESFKPPKTCTTVSWSFRIFYEKALLDYERHKMRGGELQIPDASFTEPIGAETPMGGQASGSGRARRDAAARAMQGWHSQRLLGNGEVGDPIIKDKNTVSLAKREKQLKNVGLLKRKKPSSHERAVKVARTITKATKPQTDSMVVDVGPAADWVKINVRKTKDCFEVYALVPGLLREEVRVQSDPAGRLVISGDPEQPDNPWGVTPFKKVISLPSRIDPHQTSAVVTLHGQLFVRVPFEQSDI